MSEEQTLPSLEIEVDAIDRSTESTAEVDRRAAEDKTFQEYCRQNFGFVWHDEFQFKRRVIEEEENQQQSFDSAILRDVGTRAKWLLKYGKSDAEDEFVNFRFANHKSPLLMVLFLMMGQAVNPILNEYGLLWIGILSYISTTLIVIGIVVYLIVLRGVPVPDEGDHYYLALAPRHIRKLQEEATKRCRCTEIIHFTILLNWSLVGTAGNFTHFWNCANHRESDLMWDCIRVMPVQTQLAWVVAITVMPRIRFAPIPFALGCVLHIVGYFLVPEPVDHKSILVIHAVLVPAMAIACWFAGWSQEATRRDQFEIELKLTVKKDEAGKSVSQVNRIISTLMPPSALVKVAANERVEDHGPASVIFADLAGFTSWCSSRRATAVVNMLGEVVFELDKRARTHGVQKIKTVGDAYWAVCGIPVPASTGNHALQSLNFSVAIHTTMTVLCRAHSEWGLLQFRVGIHSGTVTGTIIDRTRMSYEIFGPVSQVAESIEILATPGKTWMSSTSARRLPSSIFDQFLSATTATTPSGDTSEDLQLFEVSPGYLGIDDSVHSELSIKLPSPVGSVISQRRHSAAVPLTIESVLESSLRSSKREDNSVGEAWVDTDSNLTSNLRKALHLQPTFDKPTPLTIEEDNQKASSPVAQGKGSSISSVKQTDFQDFAAPTGWFLHGFATDSSSQSEDLLTQYIEFCRRRNLREVFVSLSSLFAMMTLYVWALAAEGTIHNRMPLAGTFALAATVAVVLLLWTARSRVVPRVPLGISFGVLALLALIMTALNQFTILSNSPSWQAQLWVFLFLTSGLNARVAVPLSLLALLLAATLVLLFYGFWIGPLTLYFFCAWLSYFSIMNLEQARRRTFLATLQQEREGRAKRAEAANLNSLLQMIMPAHVVDRLTRLPAPLVASNVPSTSPSSSGSSINTPSTSSLRLEGSGRVEIADELDAAIVVFLKFQLDFSGENPSARRSSFLSETTMIASIVDSLLPSNAEHRDCLRTLQENNNGNPLSGGVSSGSNSTTSSIFPLLLKLKTIGDIIMISGPLEPEALRSVSKLTEQAAVQALHFCSQAATQVGSKMPGALGSASIHVGPVTAAVIGSHQLVYDVFGTTVNTSARLLQPKSEDGGESLQRRSRIVCSEALKNLIQDSPSLRASTVHFSNPQEINAKGLSSPLTAFEINVVAEDQSQF